MRVVMFVMMAALLAVSAGVARAEPVGKRHYVAMSGAVEAAGGVGMGGVLEVGLRPGDPRNAPIWLHGLAGFGRWGHEDYMDGETMKVGAGVEARPCLTPGVCAVFGGDLVYAHVVDLAGTMVVGHAGVDAGSARLRVRATLAASRSLGYGLSAMDGLDGRFDAGNGIAANLGVAMLF